MNNNMPPITMIPVLISLDSFNSVGLSLFRASFKIHQLFFMLIFTHYFVKIINNSPAMPNNFALLCIKNSL